MRSIDAKQQANLIGEHVDGYRIDALIGHGGMAEVYRAWNEGLHRFEAVKMLAPQLSFDRSLVERFLNEARTSAKLRHRNIATIYMVGAITSPRPYFSMELIDGTDLAQELNRRGSLPLNEAVGLLRQVADALDYAHQNGVIHRDVKPANILIEATTTDQCNVKVVDFGIARAQADDGKPGLTQTGSIIGTPKYMSPEQSGGKTIDYRSDIYSLAIVAYEMICGAFPFEIDDRNGMDAILAHIQQKPVPPVRHAPGLAPSISDALLRGLAKDPAERFHSCGEFVDDLIESSTAPLEDKSKRNPGPRPLVLVAAVMVFGLGLLAVGIIRQLGQKTRTVHTNNDASIPLPTVTRSRHNEDPNQFVQRAYPNCTFMMDSPESGNKGLAYLVVRPSGKIVSAYVILDPDPGQTERSESEKTGYLTLDESEVSPPSAVPDFISRWQRDQNDRNVTDYDSLYAYDFIGTKASPDGKKFTFDRAGWLRDRNKMIKQSTDLHVDVKNLQTSVDRGFISVHFDQYFRTTRFGDYGPKVMKLRPTADGFQIMSEEMIHSTKLN